MDKKAYRIKKVNIGKAEDVVNELIDKGYQIQDINIDLELNSCVVIAISNELLIEKIREQQEEALERSVDFAKPDSGIEHLEEQEDITTKNIME